MFKNALRLTLFLFASAGCFAQFPRLPNPIKQLPIPSSSPSPSTSRASTNGGSAGASIGGSSAWKGVNVYRSFLEESVKQSAETSVLLLTSRSAYLDSLRPLFVQDVGSRLVSGGTAVVIGGDRFDPTELRMLLGAEFQKYQAAYVKVQQLKNAVELRRTLQAGWTSNPELTNVLFSVPQTGYWGKRRGNQGDGVADGGYLELIQGGRLLASLSDFLLSQGRGQQLIATSPKYLANSEIAFLHDLAASVHTLDYIRLRAWSARFEAAQMPNLTASILREDSQRISSAFMTSVAEDRSLTEGGSNSRQTPGRNYGMCWKPAESSCSTYPTYGCMAIFHSSGDRLSEPMGINTTFDSVRHQCVDLGAGDFVDLENRSTLDTMTTDALAQLQAEGKRMMETETAFLKALDARSAEQRTQLTKLDSEVADFMKRTKQKQAELEIESTRQNAEQEAKAAELRRQNAEMESEARAAKEKIQSEKVCQIGRSDVQAASRFIGDDIVKDAARQITEKCKALDATPLNAGLRDEVSAQTSRLDKRLGKLRN